MVTINVNVDTEEPVTININRASAEQPPATNLNIPTVHSLEELYALGEDVQLAFYQLTEGYVAVIPTNPGETTETYAVERVATKVLLTRGFFMTNLPPSGPQGISPCYFALVPAGNLSERPDLVSAAGFVFTNAEVQQAPKLSTYQWVPVVYNLPLVV